MNGIMIVNKGALVFQVRVFGAFFLNKVRPAWLKIARMNGLKRAHISDAYYMGMLKHRSILLNFSQNMVSDL